MEFTNEIYFDKNLVENQKVKLSYSGKLFREFSSEVFIVYGYGPNWDNTQEQQLNLNDECFSTELNITGKDTFNFCFRNNYNIWDNNNYQNYIATIFPQSSINSGDSSSETTSSESTEINETEEAPAEETTQEENNEVNTENFQNETDDIFAELLESLLTDIDSGNEKNEIPYSKNSYGLQNFEAVETSSPNSSLNELFEALYSEYESTKVNEAQNISEEELNSLFDKVFNYEETEVEKNTPVEAQNVSAELEELMNNILNSVLESDSINDNIVDELDAAIDQQVNYYEASTEKEETKETIEDNKKYEDIVNAELPAVVPTSKIDLFFDASIKFLQDIGVACKKLGTLIKAKAQELGFIKGDN